MRPITQVELRRLTGQIDAALKLVIGGNGQTPWYCHCRCHTRVEHAHRVADQATGVLKAASGGRGSSDHADPTYATAYPFVAGLGSSPQLARIDPAPTWLETLTERAITLSRALSDYVAIVYEVGRIETTDPRVLSAAGTGTGNCQACEHLCTGVGEDRLRSGFCPACRMAYKRAGSPDRFTWCRKRREDLEAQNFEPFMDGDDIVERLNPGHERKEAG